MQKFLVLCLAVAILFDIALAEPRRRKGFGRGIGNRKGFGYLSNVSHFLMITLVTTLYRDYLGITTLPLLIGHHHSTMINCVSSLSYEYLGINTLPWFLRHHHTPLITWASPLSHDYLGINTLPWLLGHPHSPMINYVSNVSPLSHDCLGISTIQWLYLYHHSPMTTWVSLLSYDHVVGSFPFLVSFTYYEDSLISDI